LCVDTCAAVVSQPRAYGAAPCKAPGGMDPPGDKGRRRMDRAFPASIAATHQDSGSI